MTSRPAVLFPSTRRAAPQTVQSLHMHNANTSARTGNFPQIKSTNTLYKIAKRKRHSHCDILLFLQNFRRIAGRSIAALFHGGCPSPLRHNFFIGIATGLNAASATSTIRAHHGKIRLRHRALRMNHKIPSPGNFSPVATNDFPNAPPHAIAHYGSAQCLFNAESKAALRQIVGGEKNSNVEFDRRLPARYTASKSPRRTIRASRGNSKTSSLRRELMTALLTARRQHLPAALRLHANAKPVRLGAVGVPRLICTLWQSNPPSGSAAHAREISRSSHTTAKPRQRPFTNLLVYSTPAHPVNNSRPGNAILPNGVFSLFLTLSKISLPAEASTQPV